MPKASGDRSSRTLAKKIQSMNTHHLITIATIALLTTSTITHSRDITAPEVASFLGISSWNTIADLPEGTYSLDICPIEDGKVGAGLFASQTDWKWIKDGKFIFIVGPENGSYKISATTEGGGGFATTTQIPLFNAVYSPSLPDKVGEGVFILFVDMVDRDKDGAQDDPATYKRGFVLKVTKKS